VPAADSVGVRRLSTLSPSAAIRTVCNRRCGHRTAFTIRQCAAEPGHPDMLARIGTSAAGGAGLSTDLTGWRYSPALLRIPASSLRLGLRPCILLNCLSRWLSWDSRARASVRTASGSALSLASYSCMPRAMSRRARAQNRSRQSRNSERARAWGSRRRGPAGVLAAHRPRRERLIEDDRLRAVARPAVDGDGACVWAQVSGEDPGQRPLPGSVLADTATSSPAATSKSRPVTTGRRPNDCGSPVLPAQSWSPPLSWGTCYRQPRPGGPRPARCCLARGEPFAVTALVTPAPRLPPARDGRPYVLARMSAFPPPLIPPGALAPGLPARPPWPARTRPRSRTGSPRAP